MTAADRVLSGETVFEVLELELLAAHCSSSPGCTPENSAIFAVWLGNRDVIRGSHTVPLKRVLKYLRQQASLGKHASAQTYAALCLLQERMLEQGVE